MEIIEKRGKVGQPYAIEEAEQLLATVKNKYGPYDQADEQQTKVMKRFSNPAHDDENSSRFPSLASSLGLATSNCK